MVEWNDAIFGKVARPLAKMKTIKKENSFPPLLPNPLIGKERN